MSYLGAVGLAGGLHVLAFALWPVAQSGGAEAAGAGGEALVSLAAGSSQLSQMIADWERPPEVEAAISEPTITAPARELPVQPALESHVPAAPPVATVLPTLAAPEAPRIETAPAARPAPTPRPKPKRAKPAAPQPPTAKAAPAAPKQTAKGSGGGAAAGKSGGARAATLSQGQAQSLRAEWGARIRARIENRKRYPSGAGGAKGRVIVELTVTRDGGLRSLGIAQGSGSAALDKAALDAVRRAGRFPAAPKGLSDTSYSFALPINFAR